MTTARELAERLRDAANDERDHAVEQDFWNEDLLREAADFIEAAQPVPGAVTDEMVYEIHGSITHEMVEAASKLLYGDRWKLYIGVVRSALFAALSARVAGASGEADGVYDDTDPVMAQLALLSRDGYATDWQRRVATAAAAEITSLCAALSPSPDKPGAKWFTPDPTLSTGKYLVEAPDKPASANDLAELRAKNRMLKGRVAALEAAAAKSIELEREGYKALHYSDELARAEAAEARLAASPQGMVLADAMTCHECATEGCKNPATVHFVRGGVGSLYCAECYLRIQKSTIRAALRGETAPTTLAQAAKDGGGNG